MRFKERAESAFIRIKQLFLQAALVKEGGELIPIKWIDRKGQLVAFFPGERTELHEPIQGGNQRSLANAYVLGVVNSGDTLLVRYKWQPELFPMVYLRYKGTLTWIRNYGDEELHILRPIDDSIDEEASVGVIKAGAIYGGEITFWKKIGVTSPQG